MDEDEQADWSPEEVEKNEALYRRMKAAWDRLSPEQKDALMGD